jgi:hypothetical protein
VKHLLWQTNQKGRSLANIKLDIEDARPELAWLCGLLLDYHTPALWEQHAPEAEAPEDDPDTAA